MYTKLLAAHVVFDVSMVLFKIGLFLQSLKKKRRKGATTAELGINKWRTEQETVSSNISEIDR